MNHGIATAIVRVLEGKPSGASARYIIEAVAKRLHDCGLGHRLPANVGAMLAQEIHRKNPRWRRLSRGWYILPEANRTDDGD